MWAPSSTVTSRGRWASTSSGADSLTPATASASAETRRSLLDRDLAEAIATVRSVAPDAVFVLLPWSATVTIERCAETFHALPVEIHLGPEEVLHKFDDARLSALGPVTTLQLTRRPLSRFEILQKRVFDLVFAAAALIAATPLLVLVAVLIRLDSPGPVFFVQRRYGFNQQPFPIIKFRTMRMLDDGGRQATRDDPRLTRIGSWLRRWNVDEIPQLFNVLTGDMSSSVRARTRCRLITNISAVFRSTRAEATSSPVLPAGRKFTATAARPIPKTKCAAG